MKYRFSTVFSKMFLKDFIIYISGSLILNVRMFSIIFNLNFQKTLKTYITNIISKELPEHMTHFDLWPDAKDTERWKGQKSDLCTISLQALKSLDSQPVLISVSEITAAPSVLPSSHLIIFICFLWIFFKSLLNHSTLVIGEARKNVEL